MTNENIEFAIERLTITCISDGQLYQMWDKTCNKQSSQFISLVEQLAAKWEPEALKSCAIDATISAVVEYWMPSMP